MRAFHERLTFTFVIGSSLMHVFCCGIPLALALTNIAATFGIAGAGVVHAEWFEQFEVGVLIAAGAMLVLTGAVQFISKRINCRTDGACVHQPCDKKKSLSQHLFMFAVALYLLNLTLFFFSHAH